MIGERLNQRTKRRQNVRKLGQKRPKFKVIYYLNGIVNCLGTGKYFSDALILASTNPQYDKRLFIELQVQYMKILS